MPAFFAMRKKNELKCILTNQSISPFMNEKIMSVKKEENKNNYYKRKKKRVIPRDTRSPKLSSWGGTFLEKVIIIIWMWCFIIFYFSCLRFISVIRPKDLNFRYFLLWGTFCSPLSTCSLMFPTSH